MSKQIPPELIEQIMYVVSAAMGWLLKWLQSKSKMDKLKSTNNALLNRLANKGK